MACTLLALAMALGTGLRLARLHWGLHDNLWFFDETLWALRLHPFASLGPRSFDTTELGYPTLYLNLGGIGAWTLGQVCCSVQSGAPAIGWMRDIGAVASLLAVLVTARLGVAMYGPWVGVAAAALLAAAPLEVMQVHYASVEPLMVLCVTLVILASWRLLQRGTVRDAAIAGAAVGFTTAAKYPGVAFATAVAWAIAERWWIDRSLPAVLRLAGVAAVAAVLGFVLGCPACALHPDAMLELLQRHRAMAAFAGFEASMLVPQIGWWQRPWLHEIVAVLPYGLGLPLAGVAFVGVATAFRFRSTADRLLLAAIVPYFVYMGASHVVYPRYMLPLFPPLVLIAAAALGRLLPRRIATVVAVLVLGYGLALSASQLRRFSWNQQEAVAEWLADKAPLLEPKDRTVGIPGILENDPYFHLRKPISDKRYTVKIHRPGKWLVGSRPTFFIVPDWQAMAIRRDRRNVMMGMQLLALDHGISGYRPVLRVPIPDYLQRRWDERIDPAYVIEIWQGTIGFTVYARRDMLPTLQGVDVLADVPLN